MKCARCQYENPPGSNFCLGCGTRLGATCGACGNDLPAGSRFCNKCGTPVTAPAGQARFASPESYTPQHLAEKILTSKAALEGERKQVTVLFADLKGSMELLADRDPEDARKILDPVLELMMEAVHRYEGTVNQVMGDGIMALFGAPLAHEDHAVRACYAALRMQESVKMHAEEVRRSHAAVVKIRIGLNSGEVVVRAIGSDLHMDYTAVGQTTHLAARMEQLADPGAIMITPETLALVEGYVEVKSLGPVPVKGLADPVEVYEVTGAGPARTKLQAAARRGLTRFVGRDSELEQLGRAQQLAGSGHGQVAAVVGEAGVGKSRLVYEFTHSHRLQGWLVLESASVSYSKATSYLSVIDLLKGYFRIQDRDDLREIGEKVTGKLLTLDESLKPMLPALLALLDVPVDDAAWRTLDPAQRRQHTLDAVRRLLLRESQVQPLLLVTEDLHWIDSETQALLDSLVDSLGPFRVLLLVSHRPEYEHRWGKKTSYTQLRLESLPPESTGELLHALLGDAPGLEPLKQMLRRRGNPFFLEETVRTLVETKALEGERGAYRLVRPVQSLQIPATVQAILAARIDRLPVEEKQLMQTASVIGKNVPSAILMAIAELPEEALRRALGHLQESEFLYETSLFPDLEYTFKHALTHDVTYQGLLQERRRRLHARIMEAIERLYPHRLAEQIDRLAYHSFRGELWQKAVTYLRQAGVKAVARAAYRPGAACLEQALVALQRLPENRDTMEEDIDLRFDLRNAYVQLAEHGRISEHLSAAEALARALDDRLRLARVLGYLSTHFLMVGETDRAIEPGQQAHAIATELGVLSLQVEMHWRLAVVHHSLGDYRRAIDLTRRCVEALEGDLIREHRTGPNLTAVISRVWLARCLAEHGQFADAIPLAEEAVAIAEAVAHAASLMMACWGLGVVHLRKGHLRLARPALERALVLCLETDLPAPYRSIASHLGLLYALEGRTREALRLVEQGTAQSARGIGEESLNLALLGEGYLVAGEVERAVHLAGLALERSRCRQERGWQAGSHWLLGEINSTGDPPEVESAEGRYRQALNLADKLGMRPLMAHCHFGLGKLYRRTGQREQAQEHLATATTMYREMDMRFWLEKAEAEQKT